MVLLIKQTRMKKTAVEWLHDNLTKVWYDVNSSKDLLEQAKAMEKQQIEDAYEIGFADAWDDARYDDEPTYAGAEQYYKEIYGDV